MAAFGGYYYPVMRYIGIGLLSLTILVSGMLKSRKNIGKTFVAFIVFCVCSAPYLGEMFGATGLMRLHQEGDLHTFGDELVINENRQMCYLSSNKNPLISKYCYALWNKPGEVVITTLKTYTKLLSPTYLFLNSFQ